MRPASPKPRISSVPLVVLLLVASADSSTSARDALAELAHAVLERVERRLHLLQVHRARAGAVLGAGDRLLARQLQGLVVGGDVRLALLDERRVALLVLAGEPGHERRRASSGARRSRPSAASRRRPRRPGPARSPSTTYRWLATWPRMFCTRHSTPAICSIDSASMWARSSAVAPRLRIDQTPTAATTTSASASTAMTPNSLLRTDPVSRSRMFLLPGRSGLAPEHHIPAPGRIGPSNGGHESPHACSRQMSQL